jgi:hypothetical protein
MFGPDQHRVGDAPSEAFQVPALVGLSGSVEVTVFARDVGGILAERPVGHIVMLAGFVRRLSKTPQLAASVRDIAVDASGGLAYLSQRGITGIAVVNLLIVATDASLRLVDLQ